jgi:hypothetical protein
MMDLLSKIAGKVEQMEARIQVLNQKVEGGAGGTGEDARCSQVDHSSIQEAHNPNNSNRQ